MNDDRQFHAILMWSIPNMLVEIKNTQTVYPLQRGKPPSPTHIK